MAHFTKNCYITYRVLAKDKRSRTLQYEH